MKRTLTAAALPLTILAAGLALLAPGAGRAAAPTSYKIQPIVKLGDPVADVTIKKGGDFEIGTLNDSGQIAFVTENAAGGEMLIQYANGQFLPIVVGGRDAPGGKWTPGPGIYSPVRMNQRGDMAFATSATIGGTTGLGTFRWDYQSQKVTLVAFKGLPAVNNLTFVNGSNSGTTPLINNNDEIAFPADVKNAAGQTRSGVFFMGADGQLQGVALPDQVLPGGKTVQFAYPSGITDTGVVAFYTAAGPSSPANGAYVWEKGTITPIAVVGTQIPGLGKATSVYGPLVNNGDRTALVILRWSGGWGLFRWVDGQLSRWHVGNQSTNGLITVPGSGAIQTIAFYGQGLNDAGQFALPALFTNKSTAAYLLDADQTLSPILKSGTTTALGTITEIGGAGSPLPAGPIALNNKGQVVLGVKIGTGPATLVLLTPAAP